MDKRAIKRLRKRMGLTQAEFAERAGVSRRAVQNWEDGSHTPARLAVAALATLAADHDRKFIAQEKGA